MMRMPACSQHERTHDDGDSRKDEAGEKRQLLSSGRSQQRFFGEKAKQRRQPRHAERSHSRR